MIRNKKDNSTGFRTSIGGQALMEGILMRGPQKQSIVCRKADGSFAEKVETLRFIKDKYPILGWPLIRGVAIFLSSMVNGVQALSWSVEQLPEDQQEEPSKFDKWLYEKLGDRAEKVIVGIAVLLGICLSVFLFVVLPTLLAGLCSSFVRTPLVRNLFEGLLRIIIFLLYLWGCCHMKDVKRMFSYHGAEHKTIFCYEHGHPLTVENVRPESRFHPRCGTSFLFVVIILSILVFSLVSINLKMWDNALVRVGLRLLLLPVVVALSYELNRWIGRHDELLISRILAAPGKWLQHLTTNEPDDSMIECAIRALELVIPDVKGEDAW